MEHNCTESNNLRRIENALYGNGRKGLIENLESLTIRVNNMENDLNSLAVSYSALAKAQIEYDVTEKMRIQLATKRTDAIKLVAVVFGVAIPLTALIISLV